MVEKICCCVKFLDLEFKFWVLVLFLLLIIVCWELLNILFWIFGNLRCFLDFSLWFNCVFRGCVGVCGVIKIIDKVLLVFSV